MPRAWKLESAGWWKGLGSRPVDLPPGEHASLATPQQPHPPTDLQDVFHGGDRGTAGPQDARLLRRLLYAMHGVPFPPPGAPAPAVVTLQRKSANRRILNEGEVVAMLREFGEVGWAVGGWIQSREAGMGAGGVTSRCLGVHPTLIPNCLGLLLPCRCGRWSLGPAAPSGSSWRPWRAQAYTCQVGPTHREAHQPRRHSHAGAGDCTRLPLLQLPALQLPPDQPAPVTTPATLHGLVGPAWLAVQCTPPTLSTRCCCPLAPPCLRSSSATGCGQVRLGAGWCQGGRRVGGRQADGGARLVDLQGTTTHGACLL